jgi:hypothetical protein
MVVSGLDRSLCPFPALVVVDPFGPYAAKAHKKGKKTYQNKANYEGVLFYVINPGAHGSAKGREKGPAINPGEGGEGGAEGFQDTLLHAASECTSETKK